jgi:hypothetical protein
LKDKKQNIFDNYLNDPNIYRIVEEYFMRFFDKLLADEEAKGANWIYPFYNAKCVDGSVLRDANPIFSAKNKRRNSIIRVILDENGGRFTYWDNITMENEREFVICGSINDMESIKVEIVKWLKNTTAKRVI